MKKVVDFASGMQYSVALTSGEDSAGDCVRGFDALMSYEKGPVDGPFSATPKTPSVPATQCCAHWRLSALR